MAETGRSKPSEQRELQASLRAMQIDDCKLWMQTLAKRRRPEGLKCRAHEVRSRRPRSSWSPEDTEQSEVRRGGTQPRRRRGLCEDTEHRASEAQGGAKRKNAFPSRSLAVGGRKAAGGARTRPKGVRSAGTPRRRRRGRCAATEHRASVSAARCVDKQSGNLARKPQVCGRSERHRLRQRRSVSFAYLSGGFPEEALSLSPTAPPG